MKADGYITLNGQFLPGQQPTAASPPVLLLPASRAGAGKTILCGWPRPLPWVGGGTYLHINRVTDVRQAQAENLPPLSRRSPPHTHGRLVISHGLAQKEDPL